MTLNGFVALDREKKLRAWFDKLPDYEAERCGDAYYEALNKLRQVRFNAQLVECSDCGIAHPRDDMSRVRKSDGRRYLVCVTCKDFGTFIRVVCKSLKRGGFSELHHHRGLG